MAFSKAQLDALSYEEKKRLIKANEMEIERLRAESDRLRAETHRLQLQSRALLVKAKVVYNAYHAQAAQRGGNRVYKLLYSASYASKPRHIDIRIPAVQDSSAHLENLIFGTILFILLPSFQVCFSQASNTMDQDDKPSLPAESMDCAMKEMENDLDWWRALAATFAPSPLRDFLNQLLQHNYDLIRQLREVSRPETADLVPTYQKKLDNLAAQWRHVRAVYGDLIGHH
ncbi:hypothetical protein BZG36_05451 [Bifiguratus adelaidae]|uniref:Uncharacterized protein n=1 Tax=Bifiguratus adelaidae TaxID=1938954 RepID=A0A261XTQ0_9FUNG|nr:hypothetical protein BZG36_05451 [Bifiguratus adelaidae]